MPCGTRSAGSPGLQSTKPIKTAACRKRRAVIISRVCSTASQQQQPKALSSEHTQQRANSKHTANTEFEGLISSFPKENVSPRSYASRATGFSTDLRHQPGTLSEKEPAKGGAGRALEKANFHRTSAAGNEKGLCQRRL